MGLNPNKSIKKYLPHLRLNNKSLIKKNTDMSLTPRIHIRLQERTTTQLSSDFSTCKWHTCLHTLHACKQLIRQKCIRNLQCGMWRNSNVILYFFSFWDYNIIISLLIYHFGLQTLWYTPFWFLSNSWLLFQWLLLHTMIYMYIHIYISKYNLLNLCLHMFSEIPFGFGYPIVVFFHWEDYFS